MSTVFAGLMSGTSLDGIDGVLVDFAGGGSDASPSRSPSISSLRLIGHAHAAFAASLRDELLALNRASQDEIHRAALAGNALARGYAGVVATLLAQAGLVAGDVAAIGCHGQTVRHRPGDFDGTGYSVQIGAPALLAELSRIDVVCDFRSRDVAAGGQGAPLVPAFHRAVFGESGRAGAAFNLGGIANLSAWAADGGTRGFDCGPGNALLDAWCRASTGQPFDDGGRLAAGGAVDARLLQALLDEPYFALSPPKSTGRDLFDEAWLERRLAASGARTRLRAQDVQATLAELTAETCARAVETVAPSAEALVVCGGGAFNDDLMRRLAARLAGREVVASDRRGVPPDQVEAAAFAWLARAFVAGEPGNVPAVTGAAGPRRLGCLYPAG